MKEAAEKCETWCWILWETRNYILVPWRNSLCFLSSSPKRRERNRAVFSRRLAPTTEPGLWTSMQGWRTLITCFVFVLRFRWWDYQTTVDWDGNRSHQTGCDRRLLLFPAVISLFLIVRSRWAKNIWKTSIKRLWGRWRDVDWRAAEEEIKTSVKRSRSIGWWSFYGVVFERLFSFSHTSEEHRVVQN